MLAESPRSTSTRAASRCRRSGRSRLEVTRGGSFQQGPVSGEPGAMQRAVPGLLEVVEAHDAAEVGTDGRERAGPAIDRRNGYRFTAFGSDNCGAFGRRALLVFQRVEFRTQPSLGRRNTHCGVRAEVADCACRLAHS